MLFKLVKKSVIILVIILFNCLILKSQEIKLDNDSFYERLEKSKKELYQLIISDSDTAKIQDLIVSWNKETKYDKYIIYAIISNINYFQNTLSIPNDSILRRIKKSEKFPKILDIISNDDIEIISQNSLLIYLFKDEIIDYSFRLNNTKDESIVNYIDFLDISLNDKLFLIEPEMTFGLRTFILAKIFPNSHFYVLAKESDNSYSNDLWQQLKDKLSLKNVEKVNFDEFLLMKNNKINKIVIQEFLHHLQNPVEKLTQLKNLMMKNGELILLEKTKDLYKDSECVKHIPKEFKKSSSPKGCKNILYSEDINQIINKTKFKLKYEENLIRCNDENLILRFKSVYK